MNLDDFLEDDQPQTTEAQAEALMRGYNESYRAGNPTISDAVYDVLLADFASKFPNNSYLNQREVEADAPIGKTCKLPQKMLSTQKAYTIKEIEKFLDDVIATGNSLGIKDIAFRVTPKLDGYAGYKQAKQLFTRGDGVNGTDISRAFSNGLRFPLIRDAFDNEGAGEIVVNRNYFKEHLAGIYENSRNIISGVIKDGEIDYEIRKAMQTGNVVFYPFKNLGGWLKTKEDVLRDLETMWDEVIESCLYDTDGLVIETTSERIKNAMGDTNHHHKWQMAFKKNQEYHNIKVTGIQWQTGKTGVITPVVLLEPTKISGVTVSKATGHNCGNVLKEGIDVGAVVRVCRSGLVIPYIESVITPAVNVFVPFKCPSCGAETIEQDIHLTCSNIVDCPAQVEGRIEFFFKTIKVDGFGPAIIEKLCNQGVSRVSHIYALTKQDFAKLIGGKTGSNLFEAVEKGRKLPIEDWRFISSFSLDGHGKGNCEKLLNKFALKDVFDLTVADIVTIVGFAEKSAKSLVNSFKVIKPEFDALMELGFNLVETIRGGVAREINYKIADKLFVITGTLVSGKREDMYTEIKSKGGLIGTKVTSKTDYLVIGLNVGAGKTGDAKKNGTTVITEAEFLEMIA